MVERSHSHATFESHGGRNRCQAGGAPPRYARPEDLPVPHDGDDDSDLLETQGDIASVAVGKGRGVSALEGGGQWTSLFTTPPSRREEEEDRGRGGGKRTHGAHAGEGFK